ncbi:MAG: TonB family protein [Chloracidobacterium sp.]|nr:TonB family protein [Chloracidobacterium sp.]
MLPKLPTMVESGDPCRKLEKRTYYAYADETVYELIVAAKSGAKPPDWCQAKVRFDEKLLDERLAELRNGKASLVEDNVRRFDRQVTVFSNSFSVRRVIPDFGSDRWIELAVYTRTGKDLDQVPFLDSIDLKGSEGKYIGAGAESTLGDEASNPTPIPVQETPVEKPSNQKQPGTEGLMIIGKPRALYTDEARNANTAGSVRLKVTLLANGGVGSVIPIQKLPNGLTEQAIAAARQIVFLPRRVNGVPVSVTVTIDYTFSIH